MTSRRYVAGLAAALLAVPAHVGAQERTGTDTALIRLPGIPVRAVVPLATVGGTSAIEVTLDSLRLSPAPTLEEVLRAVPMLHVRTNSRGEAEILARGSDSRQVAVLLDGVPLTLGWDGRTDVSVIPAGAPHSLRVLRGLSSVLHGPNVLGGVVELTVAGEHESPPAALHIDSGLDAHGGGAAAASLTLPWRAAHGEWLVRGGAGYRASPGVPLAAGIHEPAPASGRAGLRSNTDSRSVDGFFAARYRSDAGAWASLSTSSVLAERGIAAELGLPAPRFWRYPHVARTIAALSGGTGFHDTPLGRGDLEFSLGHDRGRTEIVEYGSRAYDAVTGFDYGDDRTLTARLLGDHTLGARGDLRASFTWADILHDETLPATRQRYRQRLFSLGAETDWRLAEHAGPLRALRLSIGAAYDGAATRESGDKPALPPLADWGARAGISAAAGVAHVHAGLSRRARFPALREAYSGALDRFEPNPGLGPERLTAFEAGITARLDGGHLQAVLFHHRLDDAIVRVALPDRRFLRVNEHQQRTTGVELLASRSIGTAAVGGDVTIQSVRLIAPALRPGRPENQPALLAGAHAGLPLAFGVSARVEARHTGRQYCLAATGEDVTLRAGTRMGGALARAFTLPARTAGALLSRAEASLAVDNATDTALFDQCGLPQPGRVLSLRVRLF